MKFTTYEPQFKIGQPVLHKNRQQLDEIFYVFYHESFVVYALRPANPGILTHAWSMIPIVPNLHGLPSYEAAFRNSGLLNVFKQQFLPVWCHQDNLSLYEY